MRKIFSFLVIASLFVGFSCKQQPKKQEGPSQMEQVMAIHDEVMPKMSIIGKLVGEIKPKVDTTALGQKYDVAMKDLQDAHTSMMDWMKEFGDRFDHDEIMKGAELSEEKQKLLDAEEEKVKVVAEKINGSIERAQALLTEAQVE